MVSINNCYHSRECLYICIVFNSIIPTQFCTCYLKKTIEGPTNAIDVHVIYRDSGDKFGGKPPIFYLIINKICAVLRPHKYMSWPLGPPRIMCSLWLHLIHFCLMAKNFWFDTVYHPCYPPVVQKTSYRFKQFNLTWLHNWWYLCYTKVCFYYMIALYMVGGVFAKTNS